MFDLNFHTLYYQPWILFIHFVFKSHKYNIGNMVIFQHKCWRKTYGVLTGTIPELPTFYKLVEWFPQIQDSWFGVGSKSTLVSGNCLEACDLKHLHERFCNFRFLIKTKSVILTNLFWFGCS